MSFFSQWSETAANICMYVCLSRAIWGRQYFNKFMWYLSLHAHPSVLQFYHSFFSSHGGHVGGLMALNHRRMIRIIAWLLERYLTLIRVYVCIRNKLCEITDQWATVRRKLFERRNHQVRIFIERDNVLAKCEILGLLGIRTTWGSMNIRGCPWQHIKFWAI